MLSARSLQWTSAMVSARLLRRELLASYHHDLLWILVSLLYGWGLAWVFVGFGCCVWFGISLWVGFPFSFWNGGGSLLFGGLVDDGFGFGFEKSCVLMKFLVFLGVGLWTVCVLFGWLWAWLCSDGGEVLRWWLWSQLADLWAVDFYFCVWDRMRKGQEKQQRRESQELLTFLTPFSTK